MWDGGEANVKRHSRYSNWKPSQREASSTKSYLSNSPTVASLLVGNLSLPSVPGHTDEAGEVGNVKHIIISVQTILVDPDDD